MCLRRYLTSLWVTSHPRRTLSPSSRLTFPVIYPRYMSSRLKSAVLKKYLTTWGSYQASILLRRPRQVALNSDPKPPGVSFFGGPSPTGAFWLHLPPVSHSPGNPRNPGTPTPSGSLTSCCVHVPGDLDDRIPDLDLPPQTHITRCSMHPESTLQSRRAPFYYSFFSKSFL